MNRLIAYWVILLLTCGQIFAQSPEIIEGAETLETGTWTLDFALGWREDARGFGERDRDYQIDVGQMRLSFGLGRIVEFQVSGVAHSYVKINKPGEMPRNTIGDWVFGTKINLFGERKQRPRASFLVSAKVPITSNRFGSGTDETDLSALLLLDKHFHEDLVLVLNVGVSILGDPANNGTQNDVLDYGSAPRWRENEKSHLTLAFGGETGPEEHDDPRGLQLPISRKLAPR